MLVAALAALAAPAGGGCAASLDDPRAAYLVDLLVTDNQVWLSRPRGPELLRQKYQEMAEDPYDFMRGSAAVFWADRRRTQAGSGDTAFLEEPDTLQVLIVGDPHPENVGTMQPGDGPEPTEPADVALVAEVNDFDAAGFGPYVADLRRAMLGLATLAHGGGCDAVCRAPVLEAEAEGWFDAVSDADAGIAWPATVIPGRNPMLDDLSARVIEDGVERDLLDHVTHVDVDGTGRRFELDTALDDDGDGVLALTPAEQAQVDRLIARYPWPPGARVFDAARRFGVGIASLPAVRYVVAWDRGSDGPEDDELLQLREVVDPPVLPGAGVRPPVTYDGQGERIVAASHALWSRPDADARVAAVSDGVTTFKTQTWSSFDASFDHGRIQRQLLDEDLDADDLLAFAGWLGGLLGAVHARSPTAGGEPALPAIVRDLGGRRAAFVDERVRDAEADLALTLADHQRFRDARGDLGPLLGANGLGP